MKQSEGRREERHSYAFLPIRSISLQMSQCNGETREENRKSFGTQGLQEAAEKPEKCAEIQSMKTPDDDRN